MTPIEQVFNIFKDFFQLIILADPQESPTLQNNDSASAESGPCSVRETKVCDLRRSQRLPKNLFRGRNQENNSPSMLREHDTLHNFP